MITKILNEFKKLSNICIGDRGAVIFLLIFNAVFFLPVLFFGKIYIDGDATYYAYPFAHFFKNNFGVAISNLSLSGYPISDTFQIGFFHPVYNFLYRMTDFLFAYHFILFIDFCLASVFTFKFVRTLKISTYGSIISSLAFVFCQIAVHWVPVVSIANAVMLLPVMMFFMSKILSGRVWYSGIMGIVLGLAFLGTSYQFLVYVLILAGTYLMFGVMSRWNNQQSFFINIRPVLLFIIAFAIALYVGWSQIYHTVSLFKESGRALTFVYNSVWPFDFLRYVLPSFKLYTFSNPEFSPYIGIIPLFFVVVVFSNGFKKILGREGSFFFWVFLVCVFLMLKYSPFIFIAKLLPVIKNFAEPSRWLFLGSFSLAIIAAYGFDYVVSKPEVVQNFKFRKIFKSLLLIFSGALLICNTIIYFFGDKIVSLAKWFFDTNLYEKTTRLPIDYYHNLIEKLVREQFGNFTFNDPVVLITLFVGVILYYLIKIINKKNLFSNLTIFILSLNMLFVGQTMLEVTDKEVLFKKSSTAEFIKSRESDIFEYRVFGFMTSFGQYKEISALHPEETKEIMEFARESLIPNLNMFSGVPIVGGYEPLLPRRYQKLLSFIDNVETGVNLKGIDKSLSKKINLLSMMNVKYIVSPYPISESDTLKLIYSSKVTKFNVPLYVYENIDFLPQIYLAKNVKFIPENSEDESFEIVTGSKIDFKDTTFVECGDCSQIESRNAKSDLKIVSRKNALVKVEVESEMGDWLVFSSMAVPGWKVTVDGVSQKIHYANHIYQSVNIPKGKHTVVFSYNP